MLVLMMALAACSATTSSQASANQSASAPTTASVQSSSASNISAPPGGDNPPAGASPSGGSTGSDASTAMASATGAYTLNGGSASLESQTYSASNADESAILVTNGGTLILIADGQSLTGNLVADNISSITLTLQNGSSRLARSMLKKPPSLPT